MSDPIEILATYIQLAHASRLRNRPLIHDRFLILVGTIAARLNFDALEFACHQRLLDRNPNHLLRKWNAISDALEDIEFLALLKQLQRRYPQEKAEQMLGQLDFAPDSDRGDFADDEAYALHLYSMAVEDESAN